MIFLRSILAAIWPQLLIGAALIGAVAYIDHRGYERAEQAALVREAKAEKAAADRQAAIVKQIADAMVQIDANNAARLAQINQTRSTVNTIIQKEVATSPRFSDPAQGVTPAMLDALNKARAESAK